MYKIKSICNLCNKSLRVAMPTKFVPFPINDQGFRMIKRLYKSNTPKKFLITDFALASTFFPSSGQQFY
ncbi:hypothetical protein L6452_12818 [Arctium lappa]|uniref:Uncharacterized protein n=1 Tax=Arctium lappa TaxID=4217 RepID=A0ACB9CGJ0_ARCLA|nr:hypothetical protein L6452_12818 [Arctium lappa]